MKFSKHQLEQKIQEILSYLLCHNMADMETKEFSIIANKLHGYCWQLENIGVKAYGRSTHLDSIRPIR